MRLLILSYLFFFSALNGLGQTSHTSQNIYLELGGSAGVWSMNWEQKIQKIEQHKLSYRIGIGFLPIDQNNGMLFTLPFAISYVQGETHKWEAYLGHNFSLTTKGQFFGQLTPGLAYRYERPNKKLFYRLAYTPLLSYWVDLQYQHWLGISVGIKLENS